MGGSSSKKKASDGEAASNGRSVAPVIPPRKSVGVKPTKGFLSHFKLECGADARLIQIEMKDTLGKEADVFLDSDDLTVRRSIQLSRYNRFHKPCASKINFMRFPPRKMPVSKRSYIHSNLRTNETGPSITSGTRQGYGSIVGSSNFCSKPGSLFRFRKQFAPRSHVSL